MAGIIGLLNFSAVSSVTGIPVFVIWLTLVVLYYTIGLLWIREIIKYSADYDSFWSLFIVTFWPIDLFRRILLYFINSWEEKYRPKKTFLCRILDAIFG